VPAPLEPPPCELPLAPPEVEDDPEPRPDELLEPELPCELDPLPEYPDDEPPLSLPAPPRPLQPAIRPAMDKIRNVFFIIY